MNDVLNWVAPATTIAAALMTASNLGSRITGYGFAVFTVSSLAWLAVGMTTGQSSLVWQNVVLTALNLFGVWRWLGFKAKLEQGGQAAQESSRKTPGEQLFPASMLTSAPVLGRHGARLGKAIDAMAGCHSGRLAYVVVGEGGVAGVGETLRKLPWPQLHAQGDELLTAMSRETFDALPALERDEWPGR